MGDAGALCSSSMLLSQKTWNTNKPNLYTSFVEPAYTWVSTSIIWSRSDANKLVGCPSESRLFQANVGVQRHRWSQVKQWGQLSDALGQRCGEYGTGCTDTDRAEDWGSEESQPWSAEPFLHLWEEFPCLLLEFGVDFIGLSERGVVLGLGEREADLGIWGCIPLLWGVHQNQWYSHWVQWEWELVGEVRSLGGTSLLEGHQQWYAKGATKIAKHVRVLDQSIAPLRLWKCDLGVSDGPLVWY